MSIDCFNVSWTKYLQGLRMGNKKTNRRGAEDTEREEREGKNRLTEPY
jgi:hypothetical protein